MSKETFAHHRSQWKSHIGFVLAAIGSAVGLGNIWRFPYLCYKNGGGAFLIPYFVALLVVGIPLLVLEIGLGHKMRGSAPASFASISRKWEWLGWWQVIFVMFGIVLYYSVVVSWCLNFFIYSFDLSWSVNPDKFFFQDFLIASKGPFQLGDLRTPIIFSLIIVWFLNWLIVFRGVQKGLERANKIFMPILFCLMLFLTIWSFQLPGARQGLKIYLQPDFSRLSDPAVWIDAFGQIFFTLSLGFGIIIAYASYLPRKTQIVKDSFTIATFNCLFSIIAGIGVFSILGYMANTTGKQFSELITESIGLAFVVYPKAISSLPAFSRLFGMTFFGILVIAGLSSAISILEAFTSAVIDKFHYSRKVVVSVLSVTGFLGGIIFTTQAGIYWLDIVDHFLTQYGLVLVAILECVVVGWFFKAYNLRKHINHYSQWSIKKWWWDAAIKIITPSILLFLFATSLATEIKQPYEGYSWLAIVFIGRDWLLYTLFLAIIVAAHPWRKDPKERML
jgi:NSS family neurotransmitter:Na+ symporter